MISETTIEAALEKLDAGFDLPAFYRSLSESNPGLFAFIVMDNDAVLETREQDYLFFLAAVVLQSIEIAGFDLAPNDLEAFTDMEETNWTRWIEAKGSASHKVDLFFEGYQEEDLLAFVEDAVWSDAEDDVLSVAAREMLWVKLKTVIDVLTYR